MVSQEPRNGGQGLDFPCSPGQMKGGMWVVMNGIMIVMVTWKTLKQLAYIFIIFISTKT
jgi:hypothetical protein